MIGAILVTGASLTVSLLVLQVAVIPLLFKYSKAVQRKMVFSNCINYPRNLDYENPASSNVVGGRNFNVEFISKHDRCLIRLGAWHIVPCSMFHDIFIVRNIENLDDKLHDELRRTQNTVVLYCHGNSNHRGSPHRLQMYKVFQVLDFHVIAFDYRGYGDSTNIRPTERGVVEDTLHMYAWLVDALDKPNRPTVLLWGHSLGTAVVANLSAHLQELSSEAGKRLPPPDALVLEAPFNNLTDEIERHPCSKELSSETGKPLPPPDTLVLEAPFNNPTDEIERHPFSKLVSWLPYYKDSFIKPFLVSSECAFTTDQYLVKVPQMPILILHSKGDKIVPHELAVKLHQSVAESRSKVPFPAPLVLHSFEKGTGLGHNNLCECPRIMNVVDDFLLQIDKKR